MGWLVACGGSSDPDPFAQCTEQQCLHNCIPTPKQVELSGEQLLPRADLYCESNPASSEVAAMDDRSIEVRAERKPLAGTVDSLGAAGVGITVGFSAAGTWSTVGPPVAKLAGFCYRSAARIVLANGFAASWAYGPFACY